jgi:molybdopterin converting factor small subunit
MVPGLPKEVALDLSEPITAGELLDCLEHKLEIPQLRAKLVRYYVVVLNGTAIQHLQGWETIVEPGSLVSILAPMGGGR